MNSVQCQRNALSSIDARLCYDQHLKDEKPISAHVDGPS